MSSFEFRKKQKFSRIGFAPILSVFFGLALFSVSHAASAATLYISPSAGQYSVGQKFSEDVMVDSAGQSINAVSGTISFYPSTVHVLSISESSSIVNFWATQPSFSNETGTIDFEGVVLNPGFSGSAGNIITVTFIAEAPGQNPLSFTAGSVLANDGEGTNILSGMTGATFETVSAENQSAVSTAPSVNPLTPQAPQISSPTNPNPDDWYATSSPSFSWPLSSDVTAVRILYDTSPTSIPTVLYSTPIASKDLSTIPDGTYYFHVQLKNQSGWGGVSHFRFKIDTAPPDSFVISFPNGATSTTPVENVSFKTQDSLSGVDHYSVQVDNQSAFTLSPTDVGTSYALPAQSSGAHSIIVTAYDAAGNSTVATANFFINYVVAPTFANQLVTLGGVIVNYASLGLVAVLVLALLLGVFWKTFKKISRLKQEVKKEVSQAEDILHRSFDLLKEDVNEHIRLLLKAKTRRDLTKEEELFLKKFGSNLGEAEKIISKEIRNLEDLK